MGFVKVLKTKAYYSRYQVKFRRRREGKTDYQQRKHLITQDKNKYNTPKYRLVVRFSNRDVTCQVVSSTIKGDIVLTAAYAHELPRYGLSVGLNNYAAAYCTGLLCGRRVLKKLGLDSQFEGHVEITGEDFGYHKPSQQEKSRARRRGKPLEKTRNPFVAFLDVGLRRTTTGSKVFAVLKGACDAGVAVPHSPKRFAGYDAETGRLNTQMLRDRIFGQHVASYMRILQEQDAEQYKKRFGKYVAAGVGPDDLEALYTKVHKAIRDDPTHVSTAKPKPAVQKRFNRKALCYSQRKDRIRQKTQSFQRRMLAAAGQ